MLIFKSKQTAASIPCEQTAASTPSDLHYLWVLAKEIESQICGLDKAGLYELPFIKSILVEQMF